MNQKPLKSARATGRELGLSATKVLELEAAGVISAEIHEGRLIRFDVEKVRKVLRKRAAEHRKTGRIPDGMVPTY
jgi:hypothetical protein